MNLWRMWNEDEGARNSLREGRVIRVRNADVYYMRVVGRWKRISEEREELNELEWPMKRGMPSGKP